MIAETTSSDNTAASWKRRCEAQRPMGDRAMRLRQLLRWLRRPRVRVVPVWLVDSMLLSPPSLPISGAAWQAGR